MGGGATAAGMGHLLVLDDSEAEFALTSYSVKLWREKIEELPPDVEFLGCGTMWVAADDEEASFLPKKREYYVSRGVRAEVFDSHALAEAEPNLRRGLGGGLLIPDDGVIYSPCAARYFLSRAQDLGARLEIGRRVAEIERDAVRLEDGSRISAGIIINAAGTAALRLTPGAPIRPRKVGLMAGVRADWSR